VGDYTLNKGVYIVYGLFNVGEIKSDSYHIMEKQGGMTLPV
jgi:hypothetical protein